MKKSENKHLVVTRSKQRTQPPWQPVPQPLSNDQIPTIKYIFSYNIHAKSQGQGATSDKQGWLGGYDRDAASLAACPLAFVSFVQMPDTFTDTDTN